MAKNTFPKIEIIVGQKLQYTRKGALDWEEIDEASQAGLVEGQIVVVTEFDPLDYSVKVTHSLADTWISAYHFEPWVKKSAKEFKRDFIWQAVANIIELLGDNKSITLSKGNRLVLKGIEYKTITHNAIYVEEFPSGLSKSYDDLSIEEFILVVGTLEIEINIVRKQK